MKALPTVIPYLAYEDGEKALNWLSEAFGFAKGECVFDRSGRLMHGELVTGDGMIMLASPTPDYEGPATHRDHCARAAAWSSAPWLINGVVVFVDDLDTHFARAREAGARLLSEIEPGPPARRYRVEDCEGQRWMFMERDSRGDRADTTR